MGTSSFRLMRVGGGYGAVLRDLWRRIVFGGGRYRALPVAGRPRRTGGLPPVREKLPP
jgi:hypothetical protein